MSTELEKARQEVKEESEWLATFGSAIACGRHGNRYCENDGVWDLTCAFCAERANAIRKAERLVAPEEKLRRDLEGGGCACAVLPKMELEKLRERVEALEQALERLAKAQPFSRAYNEAWEAARKLLEKGSR